MGYGNLSGSSLPQHLDRLGKLDSGERHVARLAFNDPLNSSFGGKLKLRVLQIDFLPDADGFIREQQASTPRA